MSAVDIKEPISIESFDETNRALAKQAIIDIVGISGGKLSMKTALFKAFYFAHLFYYRDNYTSLTEYPIVCMPKGPGIHAANSLLMELQSEGRLKINHYEEGPYEEYSYETVGGYTIEPANPRYKAISEALEYIGGEKADEMSQLSHDYSMSWQDNFANSRVGHELNIYADLLEQEDYAKLKSDLKSNGQLLSEIFG